MYVKGQLADPIFSTSSFIAKYGLPYNKSMDSKLILWDPLGTKGIVAGQEPDLIDYNEALNKDIALWLSSDSNYYAMVMTVTAPFLYPYPLSAKARPYVPGGSIKNTKPQEKCPCDCKEVTTQKTYFLHKTKQTNNDVPVTVQNNKVVCTSKNTGKSYKVDCNDNLTIQQQLNQLADMGIHSSGLSAGSLPDAAAIAGSSGKSNSIANATDCPCDCVEKVVNEQWYLSTVSSNVPVKVNVTETICNTVDSNNRKVDCNTFNNAIASGGLSDLDVGTFVKENETQIAVGLAAVTLLAIGIVIGS
jgi:hypothetical protein